MEKTADGKVVILLKPVPNTPIIKVNRLSVKELTTVAEVTSNIRKVLKLEPSDSVFLFVNECFAPSPDQTMENLRNCFAPGKSELILHYGLTAAWG